MKKTIAQGISSISRAPIVALFGFLSLIFVTHPPHPFLPLFVSWIFAGFLPLGMVYWFTRQSPIKYQRVAQEKRKEIFLAAIFSYTLGFGILYLITSPKIVTGLMFCYMTNTLAMGLINQFWKISIHASGIAGPLTALIFQLAYPSSLFLYLLILPVSWSRVVLEAHTVLQVIAGSIFTIFLTWIELLLLLPLL